MTTKFIEPDWKGETVIVLAGGPSFNTALAESLREHVCLAVNYVVKLVPWVDAVIALDGDAPTWESITDGYAGIKMCGVQSDKIDGMYVGPMYETIQLSPLRTVEIRNSGLAAIRIAAQCGASRILLVGFDPDIPLHAEGYPVAPSLLPYLKEGLDSVVASVRATGVVVEFVTPQPVPVNAILAPFRSKKSIKA